MHTQSDSFDFRAADLFDRGNRDLLLDLLGRADAAECLRENEAEFLKHVGFPPSNMGRQVLERCSEALRQRLMAAHALPILCRRDAVKGYVSLYVDMLAAYHY